MPQRKILLSVGANNYRPPLERSKSAPRLMAIEEAGEEEDCEDQAGGKSAQLKESRRCCTVDPLYPAMTLGRRRCKRGHSIRRTGNKPTRIPNIEVIVVPRPPSPTVEVSSSPPADTNDDLNKLLLSSDYNTKSPLAGELMSYLDNRLKQKTTSLLDLQEENDEYHRYHPDSMKNTQSLDDLDQYSDGEDNYVAEYFAKSCDHLVNDEKEPLLMENNDTHLHVTTLQVTLNGGGEEYPVNLADIDENSLSSGCESVSTVTTSIEVQEALAKIDSEKCTNSLDSSSTETECSSSVRSTKKKFSWPKVNGSDSESEFSDESGYVEYKESAARCIEKAIEPNIV